MAGLTEAPMEKNVIFNIIKKHLGIEPKNYHVRNVYNNSIGLFLDGEIGKGGDFYFIPAHRAENKTFYLLQNKLMIYKLPAKYVDNTLALAAQNTITINQQHKRAYFSFDWCEKLWEEPAKKLPNTMTEAFLEESLDPMVDVKGDEKSFQFLTMRDHACLVLRTPKTSKPWLNTLIKNANGKQ